MSKYRVVQYGEFFYVQRKVAKISWDWLFPFAYEDWEQIPDRGKQKTKSKAISIANEMEKNHPPGKVVYES